MAFLGREYPSAVVDAGVIEARRGETYYAAKITLPQIAGDVQPIVLRAATALVSFVEPPVGGTYGVAEEIIVVGEAGEVGGVPVTEAYAATMRGDAVVKLSQGKTPDGGDLVIENLSRVLGQTIAQLNRQFGGSHVRVFKVWRVFGVDVADEVFTGYTRAPKVNGDEVRFPLVSDMSRKGAVVGGGQLTMRCNNTFKDGVTCTYAGVETFCSHVLTDKVEGCAKYGHEYEYDGIPTQGGVAVITGGGTGGGTGFGDDELDLYPNPRGRRLDRDYHPLLETVFVSSV